MNKLIYLIVGLVLAVSLTGCASVFNLGKNQTKCEEEGCDYSDAGVCADPYFVLHNKQLVKENAYNNIDCKTIQKGL